MIGIIINLFRFSLVLPCTINVFSSSFHFQTRLHSSVPDSSSDVLEDENRSLRNQLEESRRAVSRLGQEKEELGRRLEEREREREALRRGKSDLEEQKRLLDRTLEKINKEVSVCVCVCVCVCFLLLLINTSIYYYYYY